MPKRYAVGLAWTDLDRTALVEDTDERARFMAYGPGLDVPDEDVAKVDKKIKAVADKQRTGPENKGGTFDPPSVPKPGLHTGGTTKIAKGA